MNILYLPVFGRCRRRSSPTIWDFRLEANSDDWRNLCQILEEGDKTLNDIHVFIYIEVLRSALQTLSVQLQFTEFTYAHFSKKYHSATVPVIVYCYNSII